MLWWSAGIDTFQYPQRYLPEPPDKDISGGEPVSLIPTVLAAVTGLVAPEHPETVIAEHAKNIAKIYLCISQYQVPSGDNLISRQSEKPYLLTHCDKSGLGLTSIDEENSIPA